MNELRILRPSGGEVDYSVVQDGGNTYICARAEIVEQSAESRYGVAEQLLHARIYPSDAEIPSDYPGGGYDATTDENGVAYFPAIYEAQLDISPGAGNKLAADEWTRFTPQRH